MMLTINSNERGASVGDAFDMARGKARQELAAKLAELDRQRTALDAIAATVAALSVSIPSGWEMNIFPRVGTYGAVASLKLRPQLYDSLRGETSLANVTRTEALDILWPMTPLPCAVVKDSCTAIKPLCSVTDKDREHAKSIIDVCGVHWTYDNLDDRRPEMLSAYVRDTESGAIVDVDISCLFPGGARLIDNGERDHRGRIVRHVWGLTNAPAGPHAIRYASGSPDRAGNFVVLFDMLADRDRIAGQLNGSRGI